MLDVSRPISAALSLAPVPGLNVAFEALLHLWNAVQMVTEGREQLNQLTLSVAEFLTILNQKSRSSPDVPGSMQHGLTSLNNLLNEIVDFAETQKRKKFLKLLFEGDTASKCVSAFETRLINCCNVFNISAHIDARRWQNELEVARRRDHQAIEELFGQLMSNNDSLFAKLFGQLEVQQYRLVSAMTAMQKAINRLGNNQEHAAERRFYEHTVSLLQRRSNNFTPAEPWTVSVFEIEKGEKIGSGGFSTVFRGTFLGTPVAIKEMAPQTSAKQMRREIAVWKDLAHPHIIQFIGAGCFEEPPFMVMPLMPNGNIVEFLHQKPGSNRYRLVHQVLLGLVFLHSRTVVHGDLKGANILIDSGENAVLSDFGLSAIKTDATSRSTTLMITGTRRWMSPERMRGRQLAPPADIYALAMTIYEVFTGLIPFGSADEGDLLTLVLRENERPERPSDSPYLSDSVWNLMEAAWVSEPQRRPISSDLERTMSALLQTQGQAFSEPQNRPASSDERGASALLPAQGQGRSNPATTSLPANVAPRHDIISWNSHMRLGYQSFTGHSDNVSSVAFSPDGTKLVSGSDDATIRIWTLPKQLAVVPPQARKKRPSTIATIKDFLNLKPLPPTAAQGFAFSDAQLVPIVPIHTGHTLLAGHKATVCSASFSPDGSRIVSGSKDFTIRLWDAVTGAVLYTISGHSSSVAAVQFSPDGKRLFSVSSRNTCAVWDAITGNKNALVVLKVRPSSITSAVFSPDGSQIATGNMDLTVRVCDASTGRALLPPLAGHTGDVTCVAFSPDGKRIASGSEDLTVRVWDALSGVNLSAPIAGVKVRVVSFSPDGRHVVSAATGAAIQIWEVETGRLIKAVGSEERYEELYGGSYGGLSRGFSGGSSGWLSSGSYGGSSGRLSMGSYGGSYGGSIYSLSVSQDGRRIAAGYDKVVLVWEVMSTRWMGFL